ncbi:MAG: matrixin family metalloprotease [Pseudomonadota bacterium]
MCEFCESKWDGGAFGTPGGQVTWRFADAGDGGGEVTGRITGSFAQRTKEAFQAWEDVVNLDFRQVGANEQADITVGWGSVDGSYGVIGYARTSFIAEELVEATIIMDADDLWSAGRNHRPGPGEGVWNYYAVMAHEIGHAIGLPHLTQRSSLMHASSLDAVDLTLADVKAGVALYGPAKGSAGGGDDVLAGRKGVDKLRGGGGDDELFAFGGADVLAGGRGNDHLSGGRGGDALKGGRGLDVLRGDGGDDRLMGGGGRDKLTGGGGEDTFVLKRGGARDVVTDWKNGVDVIEVVSGARRFRDLDVDRRGDDLLVSLEGRGSLLLLDAARSKFNHEDVMF